MRRPKATPNYVPAVMKALAEHGTPAPGSVTEVQVLHDDDCPVFRGRRCDCNPEVRIAPACRPEE